MSNRFGAVFGLLFALAGTFPVHAESDAFSWLRDMSRAMQQESYTGTYVYLHDGKLETLQVIHMRDASGEYERLSSLNGEAREILRDNNHVTCIWPGSKSVIVSESQPRTPFSEWLTGGVDKLDSWYQLSLTGRDRVAGRSAVVVAITPRDQLRYGHRLWIDAENFLLLGSQMLNAQGVAVEQVLFTQMSLTENMRAQQFVPSLSSSSYQWQEVDSAINSAKFAIDWQFSHLPKGFKRVAESVKPMGEDKRPTHHTTLSDGLVSVSVYIEQSDASNPSDALLGESQMGAVSAFGRYVKPIHVTVVGEVPMATAAQIGNAVQLLASVE